MKRSLVYLKGSYPKSRFTNRGFTLIELVIVVAIVAIGVALALPSWKAVVEKRQLTSAMEQVASFLTFAQSEAVKRNDEVTVAWFTPGDDNANWCIGASLGEDACDCRRPPEGPILGGSNYCEIDDAPFLLYQSDFKDVSAEFMRMNPLTGSFSIDPIRGVMMNISHTDIFDGYLFYVHSSEVSSGTYRFGLQLRVNITGRVSICNDSDSQGTIGGYPQC